MHEDLDIMIDLREGNEGRTGKYEVFWSNCTEYPAVSERCYGEICFMAKRDLTSQVSQKCPDHSFGRLD